jgi:tRNA (guanine-N7-)-methyltransferase
LCLPSLRVALPGAGALDLQHLFPDPVEDVWLEIGFGAGEHLAALAARHPTIGFVGCEAFVDGVASLVQRLELSRGRNVRIFDDDARLLLAVLPEASLGRVFVLFPDPWPKKRHHRRRLIQRETIEFFARALKDGGEFRFASDDMSYVRWTLERVGGHPAFAWQARGPGDWRARPADGVPTRYEAKARRRGRAGVFLTFARRPRRP